MNNHSNFKHERFPNGLSLVLFFLKGSVKYFVLAIFFASLVSFFDLINPKVINYVVDSIIDNKTTQLPFFLSSFFNYFGDRDYLRNHLYIIALTVVLIALLGALCRYLFKVLNTKGAETLVKRMRDVLYDQIIHLPFSWHNQNHTGDIIQRCTSDVETIKTFLSDQLTSLFRLIVMMVLALTFMFQIHAKLSFVAMAFVPIIVGYSFIFHKKIGDNFRKADEEEGKLSAIAQENLTGVRVVRAFGRESYERKRFESQNASYTDMWVNLMKVLSQFWSLMDLLAGAQGITVVVLGSIYCVRSEMTAGQFIAFAAYNSMLQWPIRTLGRVIANLSKAGISIERIRYIMNSEIEKDIDNSLKPEMNQDIHFEHVSFSYENGSGEVLNDISFTIKAGSTVGILGGTGSGKSTLMGLLDRLYDLPKNEGKITIGDVDIQEINRTYLRENIGMVLQEPYLFSRTLAENIKITAKWASEREIKKAARIASLDDAIEHFQEGYETYVGERGVTLSGGQKQRTAIAQMLMKNPPIMIFDDSLSAVDAETDAKIRKAIYKNTKESTVLLIAHRITTLMNADHIIVLNQGKIVEEGTHDELLQKQGIYHKICELQTTGITEGES